MSYNPQNPNGQAASANSAPVVIASDQSAVPVSMSSTPLPTGAASSANQTNGTQQTKVTDGTNIANVVAGDTGFNGVATTSGIKTFTFTSSGTGAQVLGPFNCEGFSTIAIHITTNSTAGLAWNGQFSQTSGGTYNTYNNFISSIASAVPTPLGTAAGNFYLAPVVDNYFQLNITALTSGTVSGTITLSNRTLGYSGANVTFSGNASTGGTAPANAIYAGVKGVTALPSAVSNGSLVGSMADKFGRQVVHPNGMRDLVLPMTQLTLTATTTETTLIGQTASVFNDILSLVVINTSAISTQVDFRDSTAVTVRLSLYVPGGDTRGISLTNPLPQNTVNNNWTAKCGTSVSSIIITGTYITNA